jgi:Predicted nucleic acid-binding protein, contains PIN domain
MITAIDSNILISLWNPSDELNSHAQRALDDASEAGRLVVCGVVFAELLGYKGRTEKMIENFLGDTAIEIDWTINEAIWRNAARANQRYAARRRKQKQSQPRRLITDFLIGAHAFERGFSLLTFDKRIFKAAFPDLKLITLKVYE